MQHRNVAIVIVMICVLFFLTPCLAAKNPDDGDIRNLKTGVPLASLSAAGYVNFACGSDGAEPDKSLSSWSEFKQCPGDKAGLYEVAFEYDDSRQQWAKVNDKWEGTKISGHPVVLSLLIDDSGFVQGIRAVTDPRARSYLKKKAYLLSYKVKSRYGKDNWTCTRDEPTAGDTPLGGLFINETCEKTYLDRRVIVHTKLYRGADQTGREFTNSTRLEIRQLGSS